MYKNIPKTTKNSEMIANKTIHIVNPKGIKSQFNKISGLLIFEGAICVE